MRKMAGCVEPIPLSSEEDEMTSGSNIDLSSGMAIEGDNGSNSEDKEPVPPSMYWGGCGFGSAFYIGVHRAMVERWGQDFYKKTIIAGGSAGAAMAIQVCLGRTPTQVAEMYEGVAQEAARRGPIRHASTCLVEGIRKVLVEYYPNAHKILQGKCMISLTHFPFTHEWIKSWHSDEHLLHCLTATCHIPMYSLGGVDAWAHVVDGAYGFSGESLLDLHGNDTLFVGIDPAAEVSRSLTFKQMVSSLTQIHQFHDIVYISSHLLTEHAVVALSVVALCCSYCCSCYLWLMKTT